MHSTNLKKDLYVVAVVGLLVGLLIQPILSSTKVLVLATSYVPLSEISLRVLICLFFLGLAPLALWLANKLAKSLAFIYQVAKFAAVGTLNSFIDLGFFSLLGLLMGQPLGGTFAFGAMKTASFLAATTNSYFWNKLWTFGDASKNDASKVIKFYVITGLNFLVNVGVATFVSSLRPEGLIWVNVVSPVCGIFAGMAGNFFGYKLLVFGKSASNGPDAAPSAPKS